MICTIMLLIIIQREKEKKVFDDIIADIMKNEKPQAIIKEVFNK